MPPAYWRPFVDELTVLMGLIHDHPSLSAVIRMNQRSARKMATVERMTAPEGKPTFVQTGLCQRVLGFGWRLHHLGRDVNLIRRALWLMPVSVGVVFLKADLETILARNRAREDVPETSHENRSFQVPHMLPAIEIAREVLHERGVPAIDIDVQNQPIERARAQLLDFANGPPCHAATLGHCPESPLLQTPPPWWG
jgi:hypothetical protein